MVVTSASCPVMHDHRIICFSLRPLVLRGSYSEEHSIVARFISQSRRTPLHSAAEAGSLECVNLLLKQGTRVRFEIWYIAFAVTRSSAKCLS